MLQVKRAAVFAAAIAFAVPAGFTQAVSMSLPGSVPTLAVADSLWIQINGQTYQIGGIIAADVAANISKAFVSAGYKSDYLAQWGAGVQVKVWGNPDFRLHVPPGWNCSSRPWRNDKGESGYILSVSN